MEINNVTVSGRHTTGDGLTVFFNFTVNDDAGYADGVATGLVDLVKDHFDCGVDVDAAEADAQETYNDMMAQLRRNIEEVA